MICMRRILLAFATALLCANAQPAALHQREMNRAAELSATTLCDIISLQNKALEQYGYSAIDEGPSAMDINIPWAISPDVIQEVSINLFMGRWYKVYTNNFVQSTTEQGASCIVSDLNLIPHTGHIVDSSYTSTTYWQSGGVTSVTPFMKDTLTFVEPGKIFVKSSDVKVSNCKSDAIWILALGPTEENYEYSYAVLSDPYKVELSVVARDIKMFKERHEKELLHLLETLGFTHPLNSPLAVSHDGCKYPPMPADDGNSITLLALVNVDDQHSSSSNSPHDTEPQQHRTAGSTTTSTQQADMSAQTPPSSSSTDWHIGAIVALSITTFIFACTTIAALIYRRKQKAVVTDRLLNGDSFIMDEKSFTIDEKVPPFNGTDDKNCPYCTGPDCKMGGATLHAMSITLDNQQNTPSTV